MIEHVDGEAQTRGADAPSVGWASGPLGAVQAAVREMSRQAAVRARAVAAFAATRPASTDRAPGERGAMSAERWAARPEVLRPVSEWAAQELAIALDVTTQAAEAELARALTLVDRLPRTLDALERGQPVPAEMARQLARAFAGLDPVADPAAGAAAVDDDAADSPVTPTVGPTATLGAEAVGGTVREAAGSPTARGNGVTAADDPLAMSPASTAFAASTRGEPVDTDGGPIERAVAELGAADFDRWLDELVRDAVGDAPAPGEPGRPPEADGWDIGGWHDPGEWLDAHDPDPPGGDADVPLSPVPGTPAVTAGDGWWPAADRAVEDAGAAVHAARLALSAAARMVRTAQQADAADEAAWQAGAGGRVSAAGDAPAALAVAADSQREELAALLSATAGGGLADRPRIAVTDAVSGALLALTDLPELRRVGTCGRPACRRRPATCGHDLTGRPGLGPPAATAGYRPAAALDRFTRARDRHCRFPGCRRRVPRAGELDHVRGWPGGETAAANLAGFCTADHRGKHQAPGWSYTLAPDGTLTVSTPSGLTAVTDPPPY